VFWAVVVAVASDSSRMAVGSEMCGVVVMAGKLGVISGAVAGGGRMESRSGVHPGAVGLVRQAEVSGQASCGRESAGGCRQFSSREAAKGDAVGLLWCVLSSLLSSQLSRICSLWHGCHRPSPPTLSPVSRGRGEEVCSVFGLASRGRESAGDLQTVGLTRSREEKRKGAVYSSGRDGIGGCVAVSCSRGGSHCGSGFGRFWFEY
jgi:hypothetical protein